MQFRRTAIVFEGRGQVRSKDDRVLLQRRHDGLEVVINANVGVEVEQTFDPEALEYPLRRIGFHGGAELEDCVLEMKPAGVWDTEILGKQDLEIFLRRFEISVRPIHQNDNPPQIGRRGSNGGHEHPHGSEVVLRGNRKGRSLDWFHRPAGSIRV